MKEYYMSDQLEEPGSVPWVKEVNILKVQPTRNTPYTQVFQHTNADRKVKDFNANKALLQVS